MNRVYPSPASVLLPAALFFTACLTAVTGCKKTSTNNLLTGNLFGFVTLNDQYGAKVTLGLNATMVTLSTASHSQTWSTTTDTNGKYTFDNISEGQYLISYSHTGYGSITNAATGFLGGGNIDRDGRLSAIPGFYDSILTAKVDTPGGITLTGTFGGTSATSHNYIVFVGSTMNVSNAPANYLSAYIGIDYADLVTFTQYIALSDLNDLGFTSGQTVYFAVYGAAASVTGTSDVEDFTTGRTLYTAISPTVAKTSIVLP